MRKASTKSIIAFALAIMLALSSTMVIPVEAKAAPKAKKIVLNVTKKTMNVGQTTTLKVKKVSPSNASKKAASVRKEKESKTTTTKETYTSERWGKEGGTTIHQISFTVDISKIKDLPLLYKLIDELKDAQNRTDSPTPATT